ncbi:hypothetical protein ACFCZY_31720 [Streptomyces sp. NPDC056237]|uniref:hypothetical protein n=1 Tax=unclassified Streptomyces TaxID=2593676 RepID=UPI0035DD2E14
MADRSGTTAQLVTQHDVHAWFGSSSTSTCGHANTFLYWAIKQRLAGKIAAPWQPHGNSPLASEKNYIEALRTPLLHETLPAAHGAIGIMVVLFGQPVSRIVTVRMDEFHEGREGIQAKLGKDWTDVPKPSAAEHAGTDHLAHVSLRRPPCANDLSPQHWGVPLTTCQLVQDAQSDRRRQETGNGG